MKSQPAKSHACQGLTEQPHDTKFFFKSPTVWNKRMVQTVNIGNKGLRKNQTFLGKNHSCNWFKACTENVEQVEPPNTTYHTMYQNMGENCGDKGLQGS